MDQSNGWNQLCVVRGMEQRWLQYPYNEDTSGDLPVPGNTYCAKVVYPTYIERMAGGRSCTPGSSTGGSTRYCCSDKDYCNAAITPSISIGLIILLMALSVVSGSPHFV